MPRRVDIDVLLTAIQAEAECALHRADFTPHVEHIHRLVTVIENRIKLQEDRWRWTELDRLMREGALATAAAEAGARRVVGRDNRFRTPLCSASRTGLVC